MRFSIKNLLFVAAATTFAFASCEKVVDNPDPDDVIKNETVIITTDLSFSI